MTDGELPDTLQDPVVQDAARHHPRELEILYEIGVAISSTLEIDEILRVAYRHIASALNVNTFFIALYDEAKRELHFEFLADNGVVSPKFTQPLDASVGLSGWIVEHRKPLMIGDLQNTGDAPATLAGSPTHSWLGVPLIVKDRLIGVMSVQSHEPNRFDTGHLWLFSSIANQISIVIENARLFAETRSRAEELSAVNEIARVINSTLDLDKVLQFFFDRVTVLFNAEAGSIVLLDPATNEHVFEVVHGGAGEGLLHKRMPMAEGIAGWVTQHGESLLVPDVLADERWFKEFDQDTRFITRSIVAAPIRVLDRIIGVVELINRRDRTPFTAADEKLLAAFADTAGIAIENARLHRQTELLYSDLKERADRLSQAYDELKELDRLKTEFVQNMSHELRTPLTFIKGYTELIRGGSLGELPKPVSEGLNILAEKTNSLIHLVNAVLSLQRVENDTLRLAPVNLSMLIHAIVRDASFSAEQAHIDLQEEVAADLPVITGDAERLAQVLSNLVDNALKFSPNGGKICIRAYEKGEQIQVEVADQGIGIPADQIEKVFDRFYQVDGSMTRRFGGAGLGLAIVKRNVEAHHGTVWVESEPGKGSIFYFTLPKAQGSQS
ncbi:MAG TPA: GAF domain-containing protein [Anaerolineae bacterium]